MTFPGESLPITSATGVSAGAVMYRAGTAVLSGSPWVLWSNVDPLLLAPGDDAVVSWVVEVVSGSGTITAEETLHTSTTEGAASWSALGSHAVSGVQTLVMPSTVTSAADILAGTLIPGLRLTATGSVTVQQVKVRVWPVGGALGGWSDPQTLDPIGPQPARIVLGGFPDAAEVFTSEGGSVSTRLTAAVAAVADAVASRTLDVFTGTGDSSWTQLGGAAMSAIAEDYFADGFAAIGSSVGGASTGYVKRPELFASPTPPGTFGVDWAYPPNEIPWDDAPVLTPFDPGAGTYVWDNNTATLSLETVADEPVTGSWFVRAVEVDDIDDAGTAWSSVFASGGALLEEQVHTLTPTELVPVVVPEFGPGKALRVLLYHVSHTGGGTIAGTYGGTDGDSEWLGIGSSGATLEAGLYDGETVTERLSYFWTPPPYRYWSPTVVREPHLRQRNRDTIRARLRPSRQRGIRARGYL